MSIIYHLTTQANWESAAQTGEVRAESLAEEGFIHCSEDVPQMLRVVQRRFAGRADLVALEVETERLTVPLKREAARSGEIYPHIYGPLSVKDVRRARPIRLGADGQPALEP